MWTPVATTEERPRSPVASPGISGEFLAARTGDEPGGVGPRIAAAAVAAIINEILDVEPGPDRDRAVAAAARFIDAGIAAL